MNLTQIRDNLFIYLVAFFSLVGVLSAVILIIGKTYYWDTSRLTLYLPQDARVTLQVQARILYFDMDLFWLYYPVHFTWWKKIVQECSNTCIIDHIPHGDALISFSWNEAPTSRKIFITPDTDGVLDVRPKFSISRIDEEVLNAYKKEYSFEGVPGEIMLTNFLQGISWIFVWEILALFDHETGQSFIPPFDGYPEFVVRGEEEGQYITAFPEGYITWDRYGREILKKIPLLPYKWYEFTRDENDTFISGKGETQMIDWIWLPFFVKDKVWITDGKEVREVR